MLKEGFGFAVVLVGIVMSAGAANDCDGKCMEMANSLGEMIAYSAGGIMLMCLGTILVLSSKKG